VRGVILVSLENASFHMIYTINWLKKCSILITVITLRNLPSRNYEYIIFGQIIFQNFHQFKAFVGLSNCRIRSRLNIVMIKGGASERCDFSQFGKCQFSYGIYN
jgi:hypothetical protein